MNEKQQSNVLSERLLSLDFFRGITMLLLVAEGTELWSVLVQEPVAGTFLEPFFRQFHHHEWNGLRFWDLIQPFFMFIVGVAMPFSYHKRLESGMSKNQITKHFFQRAGLLFLFGTGLHCVYSHKLVWELWNVLTQLSVTILIAYFLMRYKWTTQLIASVGLLVLTELLYRTILFDGYDQPFVKDHNFGTWMDMVLMGKINNGGGWVTINCIPTAAHTIWGVMAGQWLRSREAWQQKMKRLLMFGVLFLAAGYLLDWFQITPIIKRISTSSFVLASGGWALLALAISFWIIDVRKKANWIFPFVVVGMNSIFIYLFFNTVGYQWFNGFVGIFTQGILAWFNAPQFLVELLTSLAILILEWFMLLYLYRKRIFFRI